MMLMAAVQADDDTMVCVLLRVPVILLVHMYVSREFGFACVERVLPVVVSFVCCVRWMDAKTLLI